MSWEGSLTSRALSYDSPQGRRILLDDMVEREVLLQAARDLGMEDDPFVAAQVDRALLQVEDARKWAMVQAYYREAGIENFIVPEEAVIEYYQAHSVELYRRREQVRVSIFVVDAPADTTEMRTALDSGASLETLASSLSTHAPTAASDGDMGWVTVGSSMPFLGLRPELSETLFSSTPGEMLVPFRTELGWTYLTVTERREESVLPLEEVRSRIENTLAVTLVETTLSGGDPSRPGGDVRGDHQRGGDREHGERWTRVAAQGIACYRRA